GIRAFHVTGVQTCALPISPHSPPAWALHTDVDSDTVNLHLARLEALGLLGLAEVDGRTTVYVSRRDDSLPLRGRWEPVPDRDWRSEERRVGRAARAGAAAG